MMGMWIALRNLLEAVGVAFLGNFDRDAISAKDSYEVPWFHLSQFGQRIGHGRQGGRRIEVCQHDDFGFLFHLQDALGNGLGRCIGAEAGRRADQQSKKQAQKQGGAQDGSEVGFISVK